MDHVATLEAQKERESAWVQRGADAFMARLADTDPTMTPAGKGIIKKCSDRFRARLHAYVADHARVAPRPMQSPTFQVVMALGVDHVAAVALHVACSACLTSTRNTAKVSEQSAVRVAKYLAGCLEADLRFRVWRKDAEGAEKQAVARMRERMKGDPKTWRTRVKQLKTLAEIEWDSKTLAVVGMDLMGFLIDAAPDVFEERVLSYGHKTYKFVQLTDQAAADLTIDTEAASVSRPKFGLMLVPPRPWRYVEGNQ